MVMNAHEARTRSSLYRTGFGFFVFFMKKLTNKQRKFIERYLTHWNATWAAEEAGYSYAAHQAWRILQKPEIQAEVKARLAEAAMEADEALARLSQHARANIAPYLLENGEPNWEAIRAAGHLVKKVAKGRMGWTVELHDAQTALVTILKKYGMLTDRVEQHQTQTQVNIYLPQKDNGHD